MLTGRHFWKSIQTRKRPTTVQGQVNKNKSLRKSLRLRHVMREHTLRRQTKFDPKIKSKSYFSLFISAKTKKNTEKGEKVRN